MVLILLLTPLQPVISWFENTRDLGQTHALEQCHTLRDTNTHTHTQTCKYEWKVWHISCYICWCTFSLFNILDFGFFFVQIKSLFVLDPATVCDIDLSLAAEHRNLNIPANHCVQGSIVIRANVLVSLRKQLRQDSQPDSHHNQHSSARLQNPRFHRTELWLPSLEDGPILCCIKIWQ